MLNQNGNASERTLDALLREVPDRMLRVLADGGFERALEILRNAENPDPAWVRDRARNLRLKSRLAAAELREQTRCLEDALAAWHADGGSDPVKESQAQLTLRQMAAKAGEMDRMNEQMTALIRQTDYAEALAETTDLRQAILRFRDYGKEAAE
ncbi:MAG: hypothetical protein J5789_00710 [Oscillospiraceae bacterium]|nr:hypothetical protein [Oscillospiraceae bacterium]